MRTLAVLLGILLSAAAAAEVQFTPEEIRAILAHGPWPAPIATDPTNRASGRRAAVELGERLFFDTRLSADGRFSCGTCHVPAPAGAFCAATPALIANTTAAAPTPCVHLPRSTLM